METALDRILNLKALEHDFMSSLRFAGIEVYMAQAVVDQDGMNQLIVMFMRQFFFDDEEARFNHTYEVWDKLVEGTGEARPAGPNHIVLSRDRIRTGCSLNGQSYCLLAHTPLQRSLNDVDGGVWDIPVHVCPRADAWTLIPGTLYWVRLLGTVVVTRLVSL